MGEVLKQLKEIKELIKVSKRTYTTKIQSMGQNKAGSFRYMIYVTKAVEELGLKKGDEVNFVLTKTDKSTQDMAISNAKAQDIPQESKKEPEVEYEIKDGKKTVKLDTEALREEQKENFKEVHPFEAWKAKYEEYKTKDDTRLGAHIIMGKQGKLKEDIMKYISEQNEKDLHEAMESH